MAKQRPALIVASQPTSTFISPGTVPFAGVELYDQQTVNLALQFSDAFKDLSQTAASVASGLRQQQNKENLEAGRDLVNQSQKTYQELVQSGQISPAENPWLAVGAQEASGTIQGMRARAAFTQVYEQKVQNDPKFLESQDSFNALASSFAEQMNQGMGDAAYMNRAFYEAFNPFISSMAMKHQENVVIDRKNRVLAGVGAEVAKTVQDMSSQDPIIRETAASVLQEQMDKMGQMGLGRKDINEAVIDNLVALMTTSDEPEKAENLLKSLKSGTDLLSNTVYAQNALTQNQARIEANKNRMTMAESQQFFDWFSGKDGIRDKVLAGKMTKEQALEAFNELLVNPGRKITLSPQEVESKRGWILSEIDRGLVMQEKQRQEQNKEEFLKFVNMRTTQPTVEDLEDPTRYLLKLEDDAINMMNRMGWSEEDKMWGRGMLNRQFEAAAGRREALQIEQATRDLWQGTPTQRGLVFEADEQFRGFIQNTGVEPTIDDWKRRIDKTRAIQGILPESDQAAKADKMDFAKFNQMLDAYETSSDLRPNETDTKDSKEGKAAARARIKFMRLNLGRVFNNTSERTRMVNEFVSLMDPSRLQAGEETWAIEDYLNAYQMYSRRNLPTEDLFPGGPYGKALKERIDWALTRVESGENPSNVAADLAQAESFSRGMRVSWFEMQANPMGWAKFVEDGGADAVDYSVAIQDFQNDLGLTNPDSAVVLASEFQRTYLERLAALKDHKDAMDETMERIQETNFVFRGSLIPRRGLKPEAQDPLFMQAWVDSEFPGANATLVVINPNFGGEVLYAPRDENGNLVTGGRIIRSSELVRNEKMFKRYQKILLDSKTFKPSFRSITPPIITGP